MNGIRRSARTKAPVGKLFVSFWHIGLDNIPEGTFSRRRVSPAEAKKLIDKAQRSGDLRCVTDDDLLAPYKKRARRQHEKLCRVLGKHCEIKLPFKGFFNTSKIDGKSSTIINPLQFAEVKGRDRLLVVTCGYVMKKPTTRTKLDLDVLFDVEPSSVTFHLFQAEPSKHEPKRRSVADAAADLAGSVRGGPRDLSTSPRHLEGYGKGRQQREAEAPYLAVDRETYDQFLAVLDRPTRGAGFKRLRKAMKAPNPWSQ